jgi:DNA-binding NarL/FixJ family response regulator
LKEVKIVIADDSAAIRDQLKRALSRIEGLKLIGLAENGVEAVRMVRSLNPDLLVLDFSMPHKSGLEVLREIRRDNSALKIIIFTADPSIFLRQTCLEAGADFHLVKTEILPLMDLCRELLAN